MSDALADLDPALYVQPPVLDVPAGIELGAALLSVVDATMPTAVQQAALQLETAVLVLQRRWDEQREAEARPQVDARTADLRLDRAWVAVGRRLEVLLDLPGHLPQAEQAAVLYRRLFPDELAFLNLPFRQQWAQSEQRLRIIEDEGLTSALDPLVGGFVLDELRDAHEEYGRVLGIDDPKAALASPARMAEGLRQLRDAIAVYGLQLVALAHADHDRADAVRASLRPITNVRWGVHPREGLPDAPPEEPEFDPEAIFDESDRGPDESIGGDDPGGEAPDDPDDDTLEAASTRTADDTPDDQGDDTSEATNSNTADESPDDPGDDTPEAASGDDSEPEPTP